MEESHVGAGSLWPEGRNGETGIGRCWPTAPEGGDRDLIATRELEGFGWDKDREREESRTHSAPSLVTGMTASSGNAGNGGGRARPGWCGGWGTAGPDLQGPEGRMEAEQASQHVTSLLHGAACPVLPPIPLQGRTHLETFFP